MHIYRNECSLSELHSHVTGQFDCARLVRSIRNDDQRKDASQGYVYCQLYPCFLLMPLVGELNSQSKT